MPCNNFPPVVSSPWNMQTEATTIAHQDEQAVEAVRRGDAERYRELVERHERRVFALAWSRLGDAALAEEATQEAFIRAYRHLSLLSDGAKFSAWISSIARHAAIGLGLRHRRELHKRERWALEQPVTTEPPGEAAEFCPPETLRQTLAELPSAYRECLVLFYLEGRSGAEAAAALGISESALRVRLHRARAALRGRLEQRLGESLERLRPTKPIAPSIMGAVLSSSTAKAAGGAGAGMGATILSVLGKVLPFKLLLSFIGLLSIVPTFLFTQWMGRLEQRNYRDAEGFRPRLYGQFHRRMMWGTLLAMAVAAGVALWLVLMQIGHHSFGLGIYYLVIGLVYLLWALASARALAFSRDRLQIANFLFVLGVTVGALLAGLGMISPLSFSLVFGLSMLPLAFGIRDRPLRMDYNLFLRATQGMLGVAPSEKPNGEPSLRLDPSQLRAFARFLCMRKLAVMYRRSPVNVALPIPGVNPNGDVVAQLPRESLLLPVPLVNPNWRGGFKTLWKAGSHLTLATDGTVSARLGVKDEEELQSLTGSAIQDRSGLESQVASALECAWRCFRQGDLASAEHALGQAPESEVFVTPPARSAATWGRILFTLAAALLMLALGLLGRFHRERKTNPQTPPHALTKP